MAEDSLSVFCSNGHPLDEDRQVLPENRIPCPVCGAKTRMFNENVSDGFVGRDKIREKAKHAGTSKPFGESESGADLCRDTNKWMNLTRVFDREKDHYEETITDPVTGKVVKQCIEPLSKHTEHGSAKPKSTQATTGGNPV
jgi:hypothetical protein